MGRSNQHYERSFEAYLTRRGIPHLMVDDARRAVLPARATLDCVDAEGRPVKIKSFDAVVYGEPGSGEKNLLVEVKGRRVDLRKGGAGRRESWTTADDVRSLRAWEELFGEPFEAVLLFWYWLDGPVLNAMERSVFRFEGRAYAHRAVRLADYTRLMRVRSPKWGTVNLPTESFEAIGGSLADLLEPGLFDGVASGTGEGAGGSDRAVDRGGREAGIRKAVASVAGSA